MTKKQFKKSIEYSKANPSKPIENKKHLRRILSAVRADVAEKEIINTKEGVGVMVNGRLQEFRLIDGRAFAEADLHGGKDYSVQDVTRRLLDIVDLHFKIEALALSDRISSYHEIEVLRSTLK